jgi:hypothetical protein
MSWIAFSETETGLDVASPGLPTVVVSSYSQTDTSVTILY